MLRTALPIGAVISLLLGVGIPLVLPADPWVGWSLILIALALAVFWAGMAFSDWRGGRGPSDRGPQIHLHFANPVREEIAAISPQDSGASGQLPSVIVTPQAQKASVLYVGQILVSASHLTVEERSLEIAIRAFNGSSETIRLVGIEGSVFGGVGSTDGEALPLPTWRPEHTPSVPAYAEFMVVLDQPIPTRLVTEYLDALERGEYITLDFRNLMVLVQAEGGGQAARLPLWDGATMRRRDDIFTGRIHMATIGGSLELTGSATAVTG